MALDGNGTYSPPAPQFPAIPNTVIYADDFNQIILDIAAALSTAIFRDGQAAFTANQSMGGNKLTNLANGANAQDAVTVLQVFTDPNFIATTADGVKVTGTALTLQVNALNILGLPLLDLSTITQLKLPANTTGVTPPAADSSKKVATTEFVKSVAMNTALPGQTGNVGKWLQTDGTNANWADILPTQTGQTGKFLQTDGTAISWAAVVPPNIKRSPRASNTMLVLADNQHLIDITSGTFAQTFDASANLGNGWFCYLRNSGSGNITLDPNGSETIDGLTSYIMYPGEVRLIQCDGFALRSIVINPFCKEFTASTNFIKPPGYSAFSGLVGAAGGGGSGGVSASGFNSAAGAGGGGGAILPFKVLASDVSTTNSVVVGAGGTGGAAGNPSIAGGSGGSSTFLWFTANGGIGGSRAIDQSSGAGGEGGSWQTFPPIGGYNTNNSSTAGVVSFYAGGPGANGGGAISPDKYSFYGSGGGGGGGINQSQTAGGFGVGPRGAMGGAGGLILQPGVNATVRMSGGGGGGGSNSVNPAGRGGDGLLGGGGGGGGGGLYGGGRGGDGGSGFVIVKGDI